MTFSVECDGAREGVWVACEGVVGPDVFQLRCLVPHEDDLEQHAAAVARACERLGAALQAALAQLLPH